VRRRVSAGHCSSITRNPPLFNGVRPQNLRSHFQFHGGCDAADAPLSGNSLPANHERDVGAVVVVSP
jgi:hypothetical protein